MKKKDKEIKKADSKHLEEEFEGYTIEELRYQRALLALKKEFAKEKAMKETQQIKEQIPLLNGRTQSAGSFTSGLLGKFMKGLGFADYLILGYQALRIGRKMGTLFKKK